MNLYTIMNCPPLLLHLDVKSGPKCAIYILCVFLILIHVRGIFRGMWYHAVLLGRFLSAQLFSQEKPSCRPASTK